MALPFVRYVPAGVEGLTAGINFMDQARKAGAEIEAATQERQYNEERLRALQTAGLNPPGAPGLAPGLSYSPFSTSAPLTPVPAAIQGTAKIPGTYPVLGVPAAAPAAPAPATEQPAAPAPAPAASTVPGESEVGKVDAAGVRKVDPSVTGLSRDFSQLMAGADFDKAVESVRTKWATGNYGNPMPSPLGRAWGYLSSEDKATSDARTAGVAVLDWLQNPQTKEFFRGNLGALQEAIADPAAAYKKYGTASAAPAPAATPAPAAAAPGTQPAAPAPAPAPAAQPTTTVVDNTGKTVQATAGVIPPAAQPAQPVTANNAVPSNRVDGLIAASATNLQTDKSRAVISRAAQLGVDPAFAAAVYGLETSFGTDTRTSSAGAFGDMQIKLDKDGGYWAQKHFSDPKIMATYVQEGKLTQDQANTLMTAAQAAKIGTVQGNIDLGLLAIKYNELNVSPSLWGAAYNASADKIIARGKPFDGENAQYNTDFAALYNHFAGLLNTGKEIAGVGPQIQGAPDVVAAALARNPGVMNREIQATAARRESLYSTTAQSRQILDQKYAVDYQNASAAVQEAQINRDAALKAGNVAKLDEANKALRTAQGALASLQATYQNTAAGLQVTLSAETQKIDADLVDQMTQVATRDLMLAGDVDSFRRTWRAATMSDIFLQPTDQTVSVNGRTEKQYVVYVPTSDGKWSNAGLKSESDLVRELNSASSSAKFEAYKQADAKLAEANAKFRGEVDLKKLEISGNLAAKQMEQAGKAAEKTIEVNGIKWTKGEGGLMFATQGGRTFVYNSMPQTDDRGIAFAPLQEIFLGQQGSLAPGLLPPSAVTTQQ